MSRGLFSSDFVVALSIFIIILLIMGPLWNSLNIQVQNMESSRDIQMASLEATEILMRTQGSPASWNTTNVKSIGLADSDERLLNSTKCANFFNFLQTNYTDAKYMMGLLNYEMAVSIINRTGVPVTYNGATYSYNTPPANATDISVIQRVGVLQFNATNAQLVAVRVIVWGQ